MEGVEEAALARLRAWCVGNDISPNFVSEGGVEVAEDEVVEVVARDRRNAYPNALKLKVLDDINAGVTVTEAEEEALATWGTELVPLPKNKTSVLQPLDVGVMGPFKRKLRAITLAFELGAVGPSGHLPLRERLLAIECMSAPEKRKRLVERVIAAWDAVSEETIKKAWLKAGL